MNNHYKSGTYAEVQFHFLYPPIVRAFCLFVVFVRYLLVLRYSIVSMVAQWLLGNTGTNMADDEKEQELSTNLSTNHDTAWKQKYFTLLKHCRQIEQVM